MKGLSSDIEESVRIVIEGLKYSSDISAMESEKVKSAMEARVVAFKTAKDILNKWKNSPNAPSNETLIKIVKELVSAGEDSLKVLRRALRAEIDYEELDDSKHKVAIQAKTTILQAITEIDSGMTELNVQLESNEINLSTKEFQIGFPERFAKQEFFPERNYYKNWYDEEKDAIILDPLGTKGEMITLDGLNIILPKVPNKKQILFSDYPKKEQYWRRTEIPKGLTPDTQELFVEYIYEEFRRRREGIWFMNNGIPVYLTGNHYFALQWCKMEDDGKYKQFIYAQRDMFYFSKACVIDTRCIGELFVKSRRTGFTYQILDVFLDEITSTINATMGMTSKSDKDAGKCFSKFSYSYLNLPFFFRPVVKGKEDSKNFLEFAKPSDNTKEAKKAKNTNTDDYLNSKIDYLPTKNDAYDGQKMFRYLGDECLAIGTKILMSDMSFKKIEDVCVGDEVIVEGGKIMKVGNAYRGFDDMYIIKQAYGKDYIVNSKHRLYFEARNRKENRNGVCIMTPTEYINSSYFMKRTLIRSVFSGIEFKEKEYKIDPYILGLWIGDGYSKKSSILVNHTKDGEIIKEIELYCDKRGFVCDKYIRTDAKNMSIISITDNFNKGSKFKFREELERLGVWGNKHIPKEYLQGSIKQRKELLAGIIDTDGYLSKSNSYTIGMNKRNIIEDIYNLAKSCGLDTSEITYKKSNYNTDVYLIKITGNDTIPCKINRKVSESRSNYKSRRVSFSIEPYNYGEYCGITLIADNDNDRRLILEDYTITLNSGKWERPANYESHWGQISPTFDRGGVVVGKAFIGSTVGALSKGGKEFKKLYESSQISKRDPLTKRTPSGLYAYFLPAHKNMIICTDIYGVCHETKPEIKTPCIMGGIIDFGSIEYLKAKEKSSKKSSDIAYNEQLRAYPRSISDAFRDSATTAIFNLTKIYEQIEYNDGISVLAKPIRGNFAWKDGVKDTKVEWNPNPNGRFLITWIPDENIRNAFEVKYGIKYPLNEHIGAFGCDPYDISGTVDGKGSKAALHGLTKMHMEKAPVNEFFLEYIARPTTAEIMFEDVLMACVFYGMPLLAENAKPRLLYHFKNRGYRGFAMNRPDKVYANLSKTEKEIGGIPNSSEDGKQIHASAIESYISKHIGVKEDGSYGNMPFNETLLDWAGFDIDNRTKNDASISSGLAIMANQKHMYITRREVKKTVINISRYNNNGLQSQTLS